MKFWTRLGTGREPSRSPHQLPPPTVGSSESNRTKLNGVLSGSTYCGVHQKWDGHSRPLKPVRVNDPTSVFSTSSVLPLLHPNGIPRATRRLSVALFRSVGPSVDPLFLPRFRLGTLIILSCAPPCRVPNSLTHYLCWNSLHLRAFGEMGFFFLHPISPRSSGSIFGAKGGIVICRALELEVTDRVFAFFLGGVLGARCTFDVSCVSLVFPKPWKSKRD